ncbi:MAG: hypothetical protein JM58_08045 [Peptococcaceae bacterium BICA1-8]|nr:MAG: hypothetical protein JM58_08045 [Peptococcaceae bacterium BICA1-8]
MQSIYDQLFALIVTMCIGFLAGIIFDVYRVFRGLWRPRKLGTFFGDIIFWLVMTFLVFALLLLGNWGEMRIYVFLGIAFGAYLYVHYLSKRCQKLFRTIFLYIIRILTILWRVISWPFRILYKIILVPIGFIVSGLESTFGFVSKGIRKVGQKICRIRNKQPKDDE